MDESSLARSALERVTPHTFNALQYFVMAMDDYVKNIGKKTFFGKDKGHAAYTKYLKALAQTTHSLVLDGQVQESSSTEEVIEKMRATMTLFQRAFPNWPDAYLYFQWITTEDKHNTTAIITRLRNAF